MVVVLVALVSVVVTAVVGLNQGRDLANQGIRDRLSAIGATRAQEVERHVEGIERAVVGQAISPRSAVAIGELSQLYRDLADEPLARSARNSVDSYYREVVAPELSVARDRPVNPSSLIPLGDAALALQAEYVVPDEHPDIHTDSIPDWSEISQPLDDAFREFVLQLGVDDFYLITPDEHIVVYSATKAIDFGTSLSSGPHSGSGLAALIATLSEDPTDGVAMLRDFAPYAPAGDRPAAFVASPVFRDGALAGYVAVRFGPDGLTAITTNDGTWDELGDTGETYVVASDDRMRSDARGFLEDQRSYLAAARESGTATDSEIDAMERFGTTVLLQPIDYEQVNEALSGQSTIENATNYTGEDVLSSRRALDIDGVEWALFAEAGIDEIEQPIVDFNRNLLIAIAVFIVVITFLAVRWSDRLLEPLRTIADRLRLIRDGGDVRGKTELPDHSSREFVELGDDIDTMLRTLRARGLVAASRAAERRRLLRRLLPPQIAERAEAGDRDVVDQISVATVAVIVVHGLGALIGDGEADSARRVLDQLVDEADDAASLRGLDRVRLTGDAYFAVCGATRLHLDHASRAASFVLDVMELVDELDPGGTVTVSAGLDSGPITIGLTGGDRLVHDTWGPTVQAAADLARSAESGEILASAALRSQLPSRFEVEESSIGDGVGVLIGLTDERTPA